VISQDPAQGKLQPGETVSVVVSRGPRFFPAPDFRSLTREDAQALADEYGLHVTFSTIFGTSGQIVYSQSPGVGTTVEYGDTIQLFMV
jgi:serine/threonine-protein kinase